MYTGKDTDHVNIIDSLYPKEKGIGLPLRRLIFAAITVPITLVLAITVSPFFLINVLFCFIIIMSRITSRQYKAERRKDRDKQFVLSAIRTNSTDKAPLC